MAASDHLNKYQLRYQPLPQRYGPEMRHQIRAIHPESKQEIAHMEWSGDEWSGRIWDIEVSKEHRRQGIATAMYEKAEKLANASGRRITYPEHSESRTPAGDAWAKKVGGYLPDNTYKE